MENAIIVQGLSKKYCISGPQQQYKTLRESIYSTARSLFTALKRVEKNDFWAIKDVSFEIASGEVVGIIGRNGAGKSTLLKILSRITEPTDGWAEIRGRIGSLLEVGTGFHNELTGRENIFLNGAILGMRKGEIKRKFDEIVAFSEVEQFIDTPVKHYSSGMYLRLAFAVAAHLETDILLVDEVLAVGDAGFQNKCIGKMSDVAKGGRTVLLVSHNMAAIQSLCQTGILLDSGRLVEYGPVLKVISAYTRRSQELKSSLGLNERMDRKGDGRMRFSGVAIHDSEGRSQPSVRSGEDCTVSLSFTNNAGSGPNAVVRLLFNDGFGQRLFMCLSRASSPKMLHLGEKGKINCTIKKLPLLPGTYNVSVFCKLDEQVADEVIDAFDLEVTPGDYFGTGKLNPADGGSVLVDNKWEVT
jgi:lipopolysaccharide transport system ATP-binding protein